MRDQFTKQTKEVLKEGIWQDFYYLLVVIILIVTLLIITSHTHAVQHIETISFSRIVLQVINPIS